MAGAEYDVAVLGMGISGCAAAKCALEGGLSVVCIEGRERVGGLWAYSADTSVYGVTSFTHINVSKQVYAFSDYEMPEDAPDYVSHATMQKYVSDYCDHFGVTKHIRFNTRILAVTQPNGINTNYHVKVSHDGKVTEIIVKSVMICTGHHAEPVFPAFKGLSDFKGECIHAVKFKNKENPIDCRNKRVLIVGIGNSAVDTAVDISSVSEGNVFISTRSGAWIIPNYIFGFPTDHYASRVFLSLPRSIVTSVFETIITMLQGPMEKWGFNPTMRITETQPTVSSVLVHKVQRKEIHLRPDIDRFTSNSVIFKDGREQQIDAAIVCTGYRISVPYIDKKLQEEVVNPSNNLMYLYKNVYSPSFDSNIGFIGFVQPTTGGVILCSELQARWFVEVFKGRCKLPSKEVMKEVINADNKRQQERFKSSLRHTIQTDPLLYADELSSFIGCRPSLIKFPSLFWQLLWGCATPAQFRLTGPNAKKECIDMVRRAPVTPMMRLCGLLALILWPSMFFFFYYFS